MGSLINLLVLGLSHRTAPVAVREKLSVQPEHLDELLRRLAELPGVREAALLATCNRVEIYAAVAERDQALRAVTAELSARAGLSEAELGPHLYMHADTQAVHHLFRVASSLDSMVVGEPQILGQVKTTHETALRVQTAGPVLGLCFTRAFRVARRVRRETAIARNPVSVSSVAIDLVRQVFGSLEGRSLLIVGAGKMADLAARALQGQGAVLTVTNRTAARAAELAARMGGATHPFEDLAGALGKADIVLASTGAQQPVLTQALVAKVQKARRGRPLFLLDITVPRDVEPACGDLPGIYLADLDNLQEVAAGHRDGRRGEADQAEAIVEQELGRFVESQRGRQIGPVVTALRARLLGMAKAETDKMLASFPQLGERERRSVSDLTEGLVKKILHTPQIALKKDTGESLGLAAAVQLLFDLPRVEPLADEESDDDADQKNATGR